MSASNSTETYSLESFLYLVYLNFIASLLICFDFVLNGSVRYGGTVLLKHSIFFRILMHIKLFFRMLPAVVDYKGFYISIPAVYQRILFSRHVVEVYLQKCDCFRRKLLDSKNF